MGYKFQFIAGASQPEPGHGSWRAATASQMSALEMQQEEFAEEKGFGAVKHQAFVARLLHAIERRERWRVLRHRADSSTAEQFHW